MDNSFIPYRLFSLGDAAITIDFGNCIDERINKEVLARYRQIFAEPFPGMTELIPAYSSLTVCYDIATIKKNYNHNRSAFEIIKELLTVYMQKPVTYLAEESKLIKIPVCYTPEFGSDLQQLADTNHLSVEEVIQLHTTKEYRVYMMGFLPGFAYMGEVDERIAIPRKPQPKNVVAGSVGIAGKQTGIYPLDSPGGWYIIGKTPVKTFNTGDTQPILIKAGDRIQFFQISRQEYNELNNNTGIRHGS